MNDKDYEKKLIYINSENSTFLSQSDYISVFDISETIKDVMYIKMLKSEIVLEVNGISNTIVNDEIVNDGDPIFVNLNDYNRILTRIDDNTVKYFDIININLSEKFGNNVPNSANISFKNTSGTHTFGPYNSDTHIMLSDNNITKFNISLYDKNNKIVKKSDIKSFNMVLCLYYLRRKCSQF
jgi:hypothetical protein